MAPSRAEAVGFSVANTVTNVGQGLLRVRCGDVIK
jgi:hypothetical protein